jgi:hypothetical protein
VEEVGNLEEVEEEGNHRQTKPWHR